MSLINSTMLDIGGQLPNNIDGVRSPHTCELCGFEPKTKNKYREKQDHLVMKHFKEQIEKVFPLSRPYLCPSVDCAYTGKDKQSLLRHYTGKHGILEKFLREALAEKGIIYVSDRKRSINGPALVGTPDGFAKNSIPNVPSKQTIDRLSPSTDVNDLNNQQQLCFLLPPTEIQQPETHAQPPVILQSRPNTEELRMEVAALMASFQPLESQVLYTQTNSPISLDNQIGNPSMLPIDNNLETNKINYLSNDVCDSVNIVSIADAIVASVTEPEPLMDGFQQRGPPLPTIVTSIASAGVQYTTSNINGTKYNNDIMCSSLKPASSITPSNSEKLEAISRELNLSENGSLMVDNKFASAPPLPTLLEKSLVEKVEPQLPPISSISRESNNLSTSSIPSLILPTSVSAETVASIIENAEGMWGVPGPAVVVESANSMPITYIECADAEIVYTTTLEDIDLDFSLNANLRESSSTLSVNNVTAASKSDAVRERQLDFCML